MRSAHARIFERALKVKSQRPAANGETQWFFGRDERARGYRQPVAASASWGDDPLDGNMQNVDAEDFVDLNGDQEGVQPSIDPQSEIDASESRDNPTDDTVTPPQLMAVTLHLHHLRSKSRLQVSHLNSAVCFLQHK